LTAPASPAFGCLTEDHLNPYALYFLITVFTGKQQVCVFVPQKLPRLCRGKLAFAPGGCKGLFGFPGDFGAMGQDSIVGQSFILLNAKKRFLPTG
jgi:hypothetical protein